MSKIYGCHNRALLNTLAELYTEAARVAKMIEGIYIPMYKCIRTGSHVCDFMPQLDKCLDVNITFALAVVEGKPVFSGDKFWNNGVQHVAQATDGELLYCTQGGGHIISKCSWNPPKPKTVMVELTREDAEYWAKFIPSTTIDRYSIISNNFFRAVKNALKKEQ